MELSSTSISPLIAGRKHRVKALFVSVKKKRRAYEVKAAKYQRLECVSETILMALSTISTTLLIIGFSTEHLKQILLIGSISCSSAVAIGTAVKRAAGVRDRFESYLRSSLQYMELERYINSEILKRHTEAELDLLIESINQRLSVLEDSGLPVSIASSHDLSV